MEIVVSICDLKEAIKLAKKTVIKGKASLEILKKILIVANKNRISLIGYDFEDMFKIDIDGTVIEPGKTLLDKEIYTVIEKLKIKSYEPTTITENTITCGNKTIEYETEQSPEDYPVIEEDKTKLFTVSQEELNRMFAVKYACDKDKDCHDLRRQVICMENNRCIASDTYRLAYRYWVNPIDTIKKYILLPLSSVKLLQLLLKNSKERVSCYLEDKEMAVVFVVGNIEHRIQLLKEKYFDFDHIEYPEPKTVVETNTKELLKELNLLKTMTEGYNNPIYIQIKNDNMKITANKAEHSLSADIEVNKTGEDVAIHVNCLFFIDAIKNCGDDKVKINFAGSNGFVVVNDDGLLPLKCKN
ncbi:MAG: hypothetical protein GX957_06470 [Clostridiaceae bacterium]|nr:hypothetical protein [Clostridiaceae bacterium]